VVQDEDDLEDGSESDSEGDSALEDDSEDEVEAAEEQGCEEVRACSLGGIWMNLEEFVRA